MPVTVSFVARLFFALCLWVATGFAGLAHAQTQAITPEATVTLLSANSHVDAASDPVMMGLEFQLAAGWKIYWRTPGAGGRPPEIHWQDRSENIADIEIAWPFPSRFRTYGLLSNGYEDRVVLPLRIQRQNHDQALRLDASVDFFICKDICIPDTVDVALDIPLGTPQPLAGHATIENALQRVPQVWAAGLTLESAQALQGHNGQSRINLIVRSDTPIASADAFFDGDTEFREPVLKLLDNRTEIHIQTAADITNTPFALVLKTTDTAGEVRYSRTLVPSVTAEGIAWLWALALAFAGGLLINLMPCVLPVLMLKVFGAISQPDTQNLRGGFFAMSLGMISAFTLLGMAFALLRASGEALHWGVQFQAPLFLGVMIFVLVIFAAQLLDWWSLRLPNFLQPRHQGTGKGNVSEFFAGIIATVLATPCSAPLVGVTISLALFVESSAMVLILMAMGVGMASPYLLLATFPALLRWLPKPGPWMFTLKKILAISVLGTAIWVGWLLSGQIGLVGSLSIAVMALMVLFSLWMVKFPDTKIAPYRFQLALLVMLFALMMIPRFPVLEAADSVDEGWQRFAPTEIARAVDAGKTVLVDVSADWCLSCLVNDQRVFNQPEVLAWRKDNRVIAMRGDWSQPNDQVKRFLARFDRQALPFAILFTPSVPEGMLLPELLSMEDFREAVKNTQAVALNFS